MLDVRNSQNFKTVSPMGMAHPAYLTRVRVISVVILDSKYSVQFKIICAIQDNISCIWSNAVDENIIMYLLASKKPIWIPLMKKFVCGYVCMNNKSANFAYI